MQASPSPADVPPPDPFGTAALRAAVLRGWRESPTRRTEDTNAEQDLRLGAYRDRLLVELAQNAADAAAAAGHQGRVRVTLADGELRVANSGAPLDTAGVTGLASLRASAKPDEAVGRFGVGFAAVLAVTDSPRIVSTTGGVDFSAARTRQALGLETGEVPVLRLPWPVPEDELAVPTGYDTEVRLPLRESVDGPELVAALAAEISDVLLALPVLDAIDVAGTRWTREVTASDVVELTGPGGAHHRWLTHVDEHAAYRWALPLDENGEPEPLHTDVLHAPTPTDERLSLPARLIAALPIEPSRRRVRPGTELTAALRRAAHGYVALLRRVAVEHRLSLVPSPGLPRSEVDDTLRAELDSCLSAEAWLPCADGTLGSPAGATVLALDSQPFVGLLGEVVPGLLDAPVCGERAARVLGPLGAARLDAAAAVDALAGLDRSVRWWHECYDVLLALLDSRAIAADELGALPVPLADGRTVTGPRHTLIPDVVTPVLDALAEAGVVGLRLLRTDAAHPLLRRLGARDLGPGELLTEPAVLDAVRASTADAQAGADGTSLAEAVLWLVAEAGNTAPAGCGGLALPARAGWRRADELVMPDASLLPLLDPSAIGEDAPLDVLDDEFAARHESETLAAVGVLDGFAVIEDEDPAEPDHGLPEETDWWHGLRSLPDRVLAVRDLDLVADNAWSEVLRLLASDRDTWRALTEPGGYTGWWVARNALLAGAAPLDWRLPSATRLAGLYDPLPDVGLGEEAARAAGVRSEVTVEDVDDAADLLDRLGTPDRHISLPTATHAHEVLVTAGMPVTELPAVDRVRTLTGATASAADAAVLDAPWQAAVWQPGSLVAAPTWADADSLAELLDLPLATEQTSARVTSAGEYVPWRELPAVAEVAAMLELPLAELVWDGVLIHEELTVDTGNGSREVSWWVDGRLHAADTTPGLARALAWAADRWRDRYLIAALLDAPEAAVLFG